VKLARTIDWGFLEEKFGSVYADGSGRPPLPTRLIAGLAILEHIYYLSDEVVCEQWIENLHYQYFCGEKFFHHRLPLDRSSITNWRNRMGEERRRCCYRRCHFIGETSTEQTFAAAFDNDPRIKLSQTCEANLYSGDLR
jgi:Transposase domain (DUF772)